MKTSRVTIQLKANEQYFPVVLFIVVHLQGGSNLLSMDEILSRRPQFTKEEDRTPSARRQVKLLDFSASKNVDCKTTSYHITYNLQSLHQKVQTLQQETRTLLKINYRPFLAFSRSQVH